MPSGMMQWESLDNKGILNLGCDRADTLAPSTQQLSPVPSTQAAQTECTYASQNIADMHGSQPVRQNMFRSTHYVQLTLYTWTTVTFVLHVH